MRTTPTHPRGLRPLLTALLLLLPSLLLAQGTGSITGQVSNAATKAYLEGAIVAIDGSGQSATADREGRYELLNVPAGTATLTVRFAGLDPRSATVTVTAGPNGQFPESLSEIGRAHV